MKNLTKAITCITGLLSASAFASPLSTPLQDITGQIDFTGGAFITLHNGSITEIDFITPTVEGSTTSGSFLSTIGQAVSFIDPFSVSAPTSQLWSVGVFSFDLLNIVSNQVVDFNNDGNIDYAFIQGTGTINGTGYNSTEGQWSFSTQGYKLGEGGKFSFSSSTIPEPATIALFGIGLIGFGAIRRNPKQV